MARLLGQENFLHQSLIRGTCWPAAEQCDPSQIIQSFSHMGSDTVSDLMQVHHIHLLHTHSYPSQCHNKRPIIGGVATISKSCILAFDRASLLFCVTHIFKFRCNIYDQFYKEIKKEKKNQHFPKTMCKNTLMDRNHIAI